MHYWQKNFLYITIRNVFCQKSIFVMFWTWFSLFRTKICAEYLWFIWQQNKHINCIYLHTLIPVLTKAPLLGADAHLICYVASVKVHASHLILSQCIWKQSKVELNNKLNMYCNFYFKRDNHSIYMDGRDMQLVLQGQLLIMNKC